MTLGSVIKFWLNIGCFTQECMENITVALRFFFEEYIKKAILTFIHNQFLTSISKCHFFSVFF